MSGFYRHSKQKNKKFILERGKTNEEILKLLFLSCAAVAAVTAAVATSAMAAENFPAGTAQKQQV